MIRQTLLSIVLAMTMVPNAAALFGVCCEPDLAEGPGCHHQGSPASAEIDRAECGSMTPSAAAMIGQELRRAASPPAQAATAPGVRFVCASLSGRYGWETSRHTVDAGPPLVTPLRI